MVNEDGLVSMFMGVSENRLLPLNPMVLLIIIPFLNGYFIGNINPTFSDKPLFHTAHLEAEPEKPSAIRPLHDEAMVSCRHDKHVPNILSG